jgi:hypothetical protein
MHRNGKTMDEEVNKCYPETLRRMRGTLIPWNLHCLLVEKD